METNVSLFCLYFVEQSGQSRGRREGIDKSVKILCVCYVLSRTRIEVLVAGMANIIVFLAEQTFRSISIAEPATELINKWLINYLRLPIKTRGEILQMAFSVTIYSDV